MTTKEEAGLSSLGKIMVTSSIIAIILLFGWVIWGWQEDRVIYTDFKYQLLYEQPFWFTKKQALEKRKRELLCELEEVKARYMRQKATLDSLINIEDEKIHKHIKSQISEKFENERNREFNFDKARK